MATKRFILISIIASICCYATIGRAETELPHIVSVNADIGTLFVKEVKLEVKLLGTYQKKRMSFGYLLSLDRVIPCAEKTPATSCFPRATLWSYTYDTVDGLIDSLTKAQASVNSDSAFDAEFKICNIRCPRVADGRVRRRSELGAIEMTFYSSFGSHMVMLDKLQLIKYLGYLKQAKNISDYLSPQFAAFNNAVPNSEIDVNLEYGR